MSLSGETLRSVEMDAALVNEEVRLALSELATGGGGEQPNNPALPVDGALSGGVPRSSTEVQ